MQEDERSAACGNKPFGLETLHGVARRTAVVAIGLALAGSTVPAAAHDCTCRHGGHSYKQGQFTCIFGKLARCEMYLNNSSWKVVADTCPLAGSAAPQQVASAAYHRPGADQ